MDDQYYSREGSVDTEPVFEFSDANGFLDKKAGPKRVFHLVH